MIVLAPDSVQEAVNMTYKAFDLAQRDKNPVLILTDGVIGTMMEPVILPEMRSDAEVNALKNELGDWAFKGHHKDKKVLVLPGGWSGQEERNKRNAALYERWEKDIEVEEIMTKDAEVILTGFGISGRAAASVVYELRKEGYPVGLIRPKTVSPFPYASFENLDYSRVRAILDCEMSIPAQYVWDVKMAVKDRCRIKECLRSGGEIISKKMIKEAALELLK